MSDTLCEGAPPPLAGISGAWGQRERLGLTLLGVSAPLNYCLRDIGYNRFLWYNKLMQAKGNLASISPLTLLGKH